MHLRWKRRPETGRMKAKQKIGIGFVVSAISIALLLVCDQMWGNRVAEIVGFGLLIGFSYAALNK